MEINDKLLFDAFLRNMTEIIFVFIAKIKKLHLLMQNKYLQSKIFTLKRLCIK